MFRNLIGKPRLIDCLDVVVTVMENYVINKINWLDLAVIEFSLTFQFSGY